MGESRDSPARRKQYLVICTVMAAAFFHSLFTSGALASLDIMESTFPGGEFVYKFVVKDYATNQVSHETVVPKDIFTYVVCFHRLVDMELYIRSESVNFEYTILLGVNSFIHHHHPSLPSRGCCCCCHSMT